MREREGREAPQPIAHWWDFERRGQIVDSDHEQRTDAFRMIPEDAP